MNALSNIYFLSLKLIIVLVTCFSSFNLISQDRVLDSLNSIFKNSKNDTSRCKALISIADNIYYSNPDTVIPICRKVIEMVDLALIKAKSKEKNVLLICKGAALNNIGIIEGGKGDMLSEINYILKSLKIQETINSKIDIGACCGNLGMAYSSIGDVAKAMDYYLRALKIQEEIGDIAGQAITQNNIAHIYQGQKEISKALFYFNKSYNLMKRINDKRGQSMALGGIAVIYEKFGEPNCVATKEICLKEGQKKALKLHEECYDLAKESDDKKGMAYSLGNIAVSYKNLGDPHSNKNQIGRIKDGEALAINYFKRSLEIHESINNKFGIANTKNNIANLYLKQGDLKLAKMFAIESLRLAKEIGIPNIIKLSAATLKEIYEKSNNTKEAFNMFILEISMRDSISNQENKKALFQKNLKYEYDKKALTDSLKVLEERKTSDLKLQKEIATKKTLLVSTIAAIFILLVLSYLVFSLVKNVKERKRSYILLEEKNIEIQKQSQKLVELSKEITKYQTQMNPHFIFNALNSIQGFVVNNEKEKTLTQLQNFSKLMRSTLNNSANDTIILKTELDFLKLYVAFENERFSKSINFTISSELNDDEVYIPPMLIQPLIENCLKHAGLNNIDVPLIQLVLKEVDDLLYIAVIDNGKGITISIDEAIAKSHALGILKSRIKLIFEKENKKFQDDYVIIKSVLNQGTDVSFFIPLITKF